MARILLVSHHIIWKLCNLVGFKLIVCWGTAGLHNLLCTLLHTQVPDYGQQNAKTACPILLIQMSFLNRILANVQLDKGILIFHSPYKFLYYHSFKGCTGVSKAL